MLRVAVPRQRHAWVTLLRRSQTTSTPPNLPQPPAASPATSNQPLVPPLPPDPPKVPTPAITQPAPSPPPPSTPPKPKRRRFRRFFLLSTLTLGTFYAGGTLYALENDNFHDFFTEHVPFGEDLVLFWEERAFKSRLTDTLSSGSSKIYHQISGEDKVTVGRQSGVSAKAAEAQQKAGDAADKAAKAVTGREDHPQSPRDTKGAASSKKKEQRKQAAKVAEEDKSKAAAPIATIDKLNIDNAADPVVQDITKILNDVITAVNADNASGKYGSTITKAKDDIQKLASDITAYRTRDAQAADDKIRDSQLQFNQGAQELIARISREQKDQELAFREEYEAERERLSRTYEEKLRAELQVVQSVADQQRRNELLEQSIKLTDEFAKEVRDRVEKERSSRLSRLNELAHDVEEMESLSKSYASVLDTNLQTQHLLTAVEAVRTALEDTDRPTPFIHELVALKEIAQNDTVVEAAIGSIDPTAYQRGISTSAQLVDRFRRVADEVRKASLLPEDAGAASHAASFMLSKLMFKKEGLAVGDDVESVLTRTETLLEEGNLDDATREMNSLTGWARVLSRDWLAECRRSLEVKQALDVIATEARLQSLRVQ